MRRAARITIGLALAAAGALAVARAATGPALPAAPPPAAAPGDSPTVEALSGIDFIPNRATLDDVLGDSASSDLIAIASGQVSALNDSGVRLRAYRALALYPGDATAAALRDALARHGSAHNGVDTLYLRAAMGALAPVAGAAAVSDLAPLLDHPNQDVRTDAARALGATGSSDAIPPLRTRLSTETVQQVRLAIAEALRELSP
jgi:hypothetical protein